MIPCERRGVLLWLTFLKGYPGSPWTFQGVLDPEIAEFAVAMSGSVRAGASQPDIPSARPSQEDAGAGHYLGVVQEDDKDAEGGMTKRRNTRTEYYLLYPSSL